MENKKYEKFKTSIGFMPVDTSIETTLPRRATTGSAGYDFFALEDITIPAHSEIIIKTNVRAHMPCDVVLQIYPRSGHGFKHGIRLANTVGVIDSDYFYSDNKGHIMIKLINPSENDVIVKKGDAFAQGIFTKYLTVTDEDKSSLKTRNGGFGSTSKKDTVKYENIQK